MAMNALSIDIVLPALGLIGESLDQSDGNAIQLIITIYIFSFGCGQLVLGPVSDRFGRRPLLLIALGLFAVANGLAASASDFSHLLAARCAQGLTAAALRVSALAIVRDRYQGRQMAKTMSLVMMVFMAVPLMAPLLGQILIGLGPWPLIFEASAVLSGFVFLWVALRLPESLPPARRRRISLSTLIDGYRLIISHRSAWGYMLASGFVFGVLFSFITASNQILLEVYEIGNKFPLAFAGVASGLAVSNFFNSRLVEAYGMRALSHTALILFLGVNCLHAVLAFVGYQPFWLFTVMTALPFVMLGFLGPNFTALALDPLGKVAGLATSVQGFISTGIAGLFGGWVAHLYNGTPEPYAYGVAILSAGAVAMVTWTERGQLRAFRLVKEPPTPPESPSA